MSAAKQATRPLQACVRCAGQLRPARLSTLQARRFTTTAAAAEELEAQPSTSTPPTNLTLDPNRVYLPADEQKLIKTGVFPIGSRRRRAAIARTVEEIPFEQLPYQCFQEARKVLIEEREEKLKAIETMRGRIQRLREQDPAVSGGEWEKQNRLRSMQNQLEQLKILADINDPLIKKRFEDGLGDMNKPIYRYLADKKWRSYKLKILKQRLEQMYVIPDVYNPFHPTADVNLAFGKRKVRTGDFVDSRTSENPGTLDIQVFNAGERLVSIVVVDSDVPNIEKDTFDHRCHFIAANIPISPTQKTVNLGQLSEAQVVLPWLPPAAIKGAPYHRMSVWVAEQPAGKVLENAAPSKGRQNFNLRTWMAKNSLSPVGVTFFRSEFDPWSDEIAKKYELPGSDIEFKAPKPEKLPYKKKDGARYR
ncbi:phosphatidylethanolamine-binding protein [Phyllosticta citrichinensis]|uniref:Phosphatidylethanolamine-binding protein n=1 Tax=Phyllosticta citrichinensis TaxID=1130410 RepID=A0ABR1XQN6_9PEZI